MNFQLLLIILLLAVATFNSFIMVFNRGKNVSGYKFFYASLFFYNFCLFFYFVWFEAGFIMEAPHLLRTISPLMYLCAPLFYFFFRNSLSNTPGLRKKDWIHFLPALIHLLDLLPFYVESFQVKSDFALIIVSDHSQISVEATGIIPIQFHYLFRILLQTFYFIYSVYLVNKVYPRLFVLSNWRSHLHKDFVVILICLSWLVSFQFIYAVFESLTYLELIDLSIENYYLRRASLIGLLGLNIFVNFRLGFSGEKIEKNKSKLDKEENHKISLTQLNYPNQQVHSKQIETESLPILSQEEIELIKSEIIAKLKDEQLITENGLTLNLFAGHIGIPPKLVSIVINKVFNTNFKDFLNQHRIAYAITKIEGGYLDDYTLVALGELSGFNSRTTFFNAFKKCQGCSPSEYWKNFQNMG